MGAPLAEFVAAQDRVYADVRKELQAGRKRSHWTWFVFPQTLGLGSSPLARRFGLASAAEARRYLEHEILGPRLRECIQLMLAVPDRSAREILGSPDDLKFRSCMTLFAAAVPGEPLFSAALDRFFGGERDPLTLRLLGSAEGGDAS